jgi:hypoxanthine phosphoribosyltransferase
MGEEPRRLAQAAITQAGFVKWGASSDPPLINRPDRGDSSSVAVELLISESKIQSRLEAMGRQIASDYQDRPLTIVAVLTGSLIALADLVRQIRIPLRIALVQASSYRGSTTSAATLVINEAFAPDVAGRDVLLLDDILDTGQTLSTLVEHLKGRGAQTVRTAVLLRKIGRQLIPLEPDYCGFIIPDTFVVGYGLDYNDEYRHLPYVGVLHQGQPIGGEDQEGDEAIVR